MKMIIVQSSNISSIGYDNRTLYVRFHSGGLYAYRNVPASVYRELMCSASKGQYFQAYIKGRYAEQRVH